MADNYFTLKAAVEEMGFVDAHDHIIHPNIGEKIDEVYEGDYYSVLSNIILSFSNMPSFLSSGMDNRLLDNIKKGVIHKEKARDEILKFSKNVKNTIPYVCTVKGISNLYGDKYKEITSENWNELERVVEDNYKDLYRWYKKVFQKMKIKKSLLNMWAAWGASYYGDYLSTLSNDELKIDEECFARIATFDSHALEPFSDVTAKYAEIVKTSYSTLSEYTDFLEKLAENFVMKKNVKGLKVSEEYFRKLDYKRVDFKTAQKCFKRDRTMEEWHTLSNYIAYRIFELAEHYGVPVQIHTGMKWGELDVVDINPVHLEQTFSDFRNVKFDLLHCGYPYMGETSVLACNTPNVFINMSWVPLISYDLTVEWLGRYLDMIPGNKITLGFDVFDVETMCGTMLITKDIVARVLANKVDNGLWSLADSINTAEMLFSKNAEQLYKL